MVVRAEGKAKVAPIDQRGINVAVVCGVLARPAQLRALPSGDQVVAYEVTVPGPSSRCETVPVVWMDAPAGAADHDVGERVLVVGRVRRRFFRVGGSTQSRTEVVAETVVRAGRAASTRKALALAQSLLAGATP